MPAIFYDEPPAEQPDRRDCAHVVVCGHRALAADAGRAAASANRPQFYLHGRKEPGARRVHHPRPAVRALRATEMDRAAVRAERAVSFPQGDGDSRLAAA